MGASPGLRILVIITLRALRDEKWGSAFCPPDGIRWPADWPVVANPLFYMVELFRYGMLGVADVHAGIAVSIMLFASLALFVFAAKLIERGTGIRE